MSRAPEGAEVGLYVDLLARVRVGHVIQTPSGRRYGVVSVRVQERGIHAGRQHLRCVVLGPDAELSARIRLHEIVWYKRGRARRSR
jgi:hypothetical protein